MRQPPRWIRDKGEKARDIWKYACSRLGGKASCQTLISYWKNEAKIAGISTYVSEKYSDQAIEDLVDGDFKETSEEDIIVQLILAGLGEAEVEYWLRRAESSPGKEIVIALDKVGMEELAIYRENGQWFVRR